MLADDRQLKEPSNYQHWQQQSLFLELSNFSASFAAGSKVSAVTLYRQLLVSADYCCQHWLAGLDHDFWCCVLPHCKALTCPAVRWVFFWLLEHFSNSGRMSFPMLPVTDTDLSCHQIFGESLSVAVFCRVFATCISWVLSSESWCNWHWHLLPRSSVSEWWMIEVWRMILTVHTGKRNRDTRKLSFMSVTSHNQA